METIVVIGPLPPPLGGVRIAGAQLIATLEERIESEVVVVELELGSARSRLWWFKNVRKLLRIPSKRGERDVWILNADFRTVITLALPVLVIGKARGSRLVIRKFAGNFDLRLEAIGSLVRSSVLRLMRRFDLVLVETSRLQEELSDELPNLEILRNGRDLEKFRLREVEIASSERHRFLYLGHISNEKGLELLLVAWSEVKDQVPTAELTLCGPIQSSDKAGVEARIFEAGATLLPPVEPADVPRLILESDSLVFPSLMSSEGHPGVLVEALLTGTPSVVVESGSAAEVVAQGGGLVVAADSGQLADAMRDVATDTELYDRLRNEALEARNSWGMLAVVEPLMAWLDNG